MPSFDSDDEVGPWIPVGHRRRGAPPSGSNSDNSRLDEDRRPNLIPRLLPNDQADDNDDDDSNSSIPPLIPRNPVDSSDDDDDSVPGLVDRDATYDENSISSSIPDLLAPYNENYDSTSSSDNDEPNVVNRNTNILNILNPRRRFHISRGSSGNSSGSENNNIMDQARARLAASGAQIIVPRIHEFSSAAALESSLRSALLFSSVLDWERFWEGGYGTEDADGWSDGEARDNDNDDSQELAEHTVTVLDCGDSYDDDHDGHDNEEDRKPPAGHVFPRLEGEPWKYDDDNNNNNSNPVAPKPPSRVFNPFGHTPMFMPSMMETDPMHSMSPNMRGPVGSTERLGLGLVPQPRINSRPWRTTELPNRGDFGSWSNPLEEGPSRPMLPSWRHTPIDHFSFAGTQARRAPLPGAAPQPFTFGTNTPYGQDVAPTARNESRSGDYNYVHSGGNNESENHGGDDDDTSDDEDEEEVD